MYQGSRKMVTGLLPVLCRHVSRSSHGPPSFSTVLSDSVALRRNFSSETAKSSEAFGRQPPSFTFTSRLRQQREDSSQGPDTVIDRGSRQGWGGSRQPGGWVAGDSMNPVQKPPPPPPRLDLVEAYNDIALKPLGEVRKLRLQQIRRDFGIHESDCGSSECQIATLTSKIGFMAEHMGKHRKDVHSRKGLEGMLSQRKKFMQFLRRTNWDSYCNIIERLGLRDKLDVQR